ncbi:MAG TPA: hypothetical protein ENK21_02085 [Trueperaceae bacterium]|nr:hypothetical protein [Trueperaceae bacterium]
MLIKGSNEVKVSRKKLWKYLLDPKALKKAVPGIKTISLEDGIYYAEIELSFGFISGKYQGEFSIVEQDKPKSMLIALTGSSKNNSISTTALINLEKSKTGTIVSYKSKPKISGRIAFMGQRFFNNIAHKIAQQFFGNIEKQILAAELKKKSVKKKKAKKKKRKKN